MSLITNRKVHFDYEILDTLSAGIELFGFEVKAVRAGKANLEGSHVTVRGGEAFLVHMHIEPYQQANTPIEYDPYRNRKLLLHKKEIALLAQKESAAGLTIVPISVYNKGKVLKLDIAVVRGKKKFDKRETLKKRTTEREIRREHKDH